MVDECYTCIIHVKISLSQFIALQTNIYKWNWDLIKTEKVDVPGTCRYGEDGEKEKLLEVMYYETTSSRRFWETGSIGI